MRYSKFLKTLVCPICKQKLRISKDDLICPVHGRYPIINGVPDFIKQDHNFDQHWKHFKTIEYPRKKMEGAKNFLDPILRFIGGKKALVLDIGCGDGIHANILKDYPKITYVGLDASDIVFHIRNQFSNENLYFVRADAISLPFHPASFDAAFSFGVFNYTDDPKRCFNEMSYILRDGGMAGLWLYPKRNLFLRFAFHSLRFPLLRLPESAQHVVSYFLVPLLFVVPKKSGLNPFNAKWSECAEIIAVNLFPRTVQFFDEYTITSWWKTNDYRSFEIDRENPMTIYGVK